MTLNLLGDFAMPGQRIVSFRDEVSEKEWGAAPRQGIEMAGAV
jgi:hypothetical protein